MRLTEFVLQLDSLHEFTGKSVSIDLERGRLKYGSTVLIDDGKVLEASVTCQGEVIKFDTEPYRGTIEQCLEDLDKLYWQYWISVPGNDTPRRVSIPAKRLEDMTRDELVHGVDRRQAWFVLAASILYLRVVGYNPVLEGFFYRSQIHRQVVLFRSWFTGSAKSS